MSTPAWFTDAIAQPYDALGLEVDGLRIALPRLGQVGRPERRARARRGGQLRMVGPRRAFPRPSSTGSLAIDLSGHGSSEHRQDYSLDTWAEEVLAVAATRATRRPVIIGHSMGGFVALTAARHHGPDVRGVAAIDSPVREMSPEARELVEEHLQAAPAPGASGPGDRRRPVQVAARRRGPGVHPSPHRRAVGARGRGRLVLGVRPADLPQLADGTRGPRGSRVRGGPRAG